jgi:hypothetical protein
VYVCVYVYMYVCVCRCVSVYVYVYVCIVRTNLKSYPRMFIPQRRVIRPVALPLVLAPGIADLDVCVCMCVYIVCVCHMVCQEDCK